LFYAGLPADPANLDRAAAVHDRKSASGLFCFANAQVTPLAKREMQAAKRQ
jgi:hypothetical protein